MECLFCKIISGEVPASKVYEDELVYAFLDIAPSSNGHTLIMPKKHVERFNDMSPDDAASFFKAVNKIVKAVENGVSADGSNVGLNNGKVAGQEVPHVHVHVIPRYEDDGGGGMKSIVHTNPETDNFDEIATRIWEAF
ncbi:MAG: HIT family protein [Methanohalobium sp.]|uniref:HIT family protein n=1 Tax=Methanohalobium sp. TaxID=2837493 RepID=UPI00397B246F